MAVDEELRAEVRAHLSTMGGIEEKSIVSGIGFAWRGNPAGAESKGSRYYAWARIALLPEHDDDIKPAPANAATDETCSTSRLRERLWHW